LAPPGTYDVLCVCSNCGWGYPDGSLLRFPSGDKVSAFLCPNCDCQSLKAAKTVSARKKTVPKSKVPREEPSPAEDTRIDEVEAALRKLGTTKKAAVAEARRVCLASPSASVEELVRQVLARSPP